jgi:hypothetical protein
LTSLCPTCQKEIPNPPPNFCPNCGKQVLFVKEKKKSELTKNTQISIHELGNKLEQCVEKILIGMGFDTKRRCRIKGESGVSYEIDVVGKKGQTLLAVECKNWKHPIGWEKIGSFRSKIKDLGPKWNGIFVSYPGGFTETAEDFAEKYNIDTWHSDFLMQEFLAVSVGRAEYITYGKRKTVRNALPLNFEFNKSSKNNIKNNHNLDNTGTLSFHPYYVANYRFQEKYKDPTKKAHTFRDKWQVFIDALEGSILNSNPSSTQSIKTKLKIIVSKDARESNRRKESIISELRSFSFLKECSIECGKNYKVRILEPVIPPRYAKKTAIEFIKTKNTHIVNYRTKDSILKTITHVPNRTSIKILPLVLINVPRWDITFSVLGKSYSKEVLGCSGAVLEDTIRYCSEHTGPFKKENIAVCEVCGSAFCEKHIFQCPICGKWLCLEDGIRCNNCNEVFCKSHKLIICKVCEKPVCEDCLTTCSICNNTFCKRHIEECSKCESQVCPDCCSTVGRIRRKKICKKCK